jgi:hypothetical protein
MSELSKSNAVKHSFAIYRLFASQLNLSNNYPPTIFTAIKSQFVLYNTRKVCYHKKK